jgi:Skp family chaperone for outer membrane proteins
MGGYATARLIVPDRSVLVDGLGCDGSSDQGPQEISMRTRTGGRVSNNVLLALSLAIAATAGLGAVAMQGRVAQPTKVAVVKMVPLMEQLLQDAEDRTAIQGMDQQFKLERQQRLEAMEKRQQEIKAMPETKQRDEAMDQLALDKIYLDLWWAESKQEILIERSMRFERLHGLITKAIAELAAAEGYDLVLVDDSADKLIVDEQMKVPPAMQRAQQLGSRRVLFVNPMIDITEELGVRMNNAFKAKPQ